MNAAYFNNLSAGNFYFGNCAFMYTGGPDWSATRTFMIKVKLK
jgi:hypothetical protein